MSQSFTPINEMDAGWLSWLVGSVSTRGRGLGDSQADCAAGSMNIQPTNHRAHETFKQPIARSMELSSSQSQGPQNIQPTNHIVHGTFNRPIVAADELGHIWLSRQRGRSGDRLYNYMCMVHRSQTLCVLEIGCLRVRCVLSFHA